jgi:hypothetical protein
MSEDFKRNVVGTGQAVVVSTLVQDRTQLKSSTMRSTEGRLENSTVKNQFRHSHVLLATRVRPYFIPHVHARMAK